MRLDSQILREVGALARCVQSLSDIRFRELDLQRGQFVFLTRICEAPGLALGQLAEVVKVDKATATKAVQKLAVSGYVRREQDQHDKRLIHLFPSEKGQAVYEQIIAEENRNLAVCLEGITAAEAALLERSLRRMQEQLAVEWRAVKGQ